MILRIINTIILISILMIWCGIDMRYKIIVIIFGLDLNCILFYKLFILFDVKMQVKRSSTGVIGIQL